MARAAGRFALLCLIVVGLAGCRPFAATTADGPASDPPKPAQAPTPPPLPWGCVLVHKDRLEWAPAAGGAAPRILETGTEDLEGFEVAVSPDAQKCAWGIANKEVNLADLATGKSAKVPATVQGEYIWRVSLAWAPDSRRLAYTDGGNVFVTDLAGASKQLTTIGDVGDMCWSPDGTQIAFTRRDKLDKDLGLLRVSAAGGEPAQLVASTGDVFGASAPRWSPDGKTIAFTHAWEGGSLCFVSADGKTRRIDVGTAWAPLIWLADSSGVVYDATAPEGPVDGLKRCTIAGQPEMVLPGLVFGYDMLPTGELLSIQGEGGGEEGYATQLRIRVAGSATAKAPERWNTTLKGSHAACRWRPDGKAVAILAEDVGPLGTVYTGDVGKTLVPLVSEARRLVGWAQAAPTATEDTK